MKFGEMTSLALLGAVPPMVQGFKLESYIGVEGNVLLAVVLGTLAAIVFVKGKEPRKELYMVALGSVVIGCAMTSLVALAVQAIYEVDIQPKHMASMGIVAGSFMRFLIPPIIERIPNWLDAIRIPFFSKDKGD